MLKRLEYIDVMRGIAILLVIFEHCIGILQDNTARFILSFHMPLFFFISGCFLKPLFMCDGVWGGVKNLIFKKIKTILVPQVTLAFICIVETILVDVLLKKSISFSEINFLAQFGNWFLITLFLMEIIAIPIITIIRNKKTLFFIAIVIFCILCVTDHVSVIYFQQVLVALFWGILGYLCKPWIELYGKSTGRWKGFGWIIMLVVAMLSMYNMPIAMYLNQYGNKLLFVITSLLGILAVFDISVSLKNTTFFQWCGRESIVLYILQFSVIRVAMVLCTKLIPEFEYSHYPYYIITFFVSVIILTPITLICSKYLRFAFGR